MVLRLILRCTAGQRFCPLVEGLPDRARQQHQLSGRESYLNTDEPILQSDDRSNG